MRKYQTKKITVDAELFTSHPFTPPANVVLRPEYNSEGVSGYQRKCLFFESDGGRILKAPPGTWIVRGLRNGAEHPSTWMMSPEDFEKKYEPVSQPAKQ